MGILWNHPWTPWKEAGKSNCHPITKQIAKIGDGHEKTHHRDLFRFIRLPVDIVHVTCPVCEAGSDPRNLCVYDAALPMYDPHELLNYLYTSGHIYVPDAEIETLGFSLIV